MTIYVTGGVDWFYTVLNAVAMIFNNGTLLSEVTLMGAMFAIITGAWFYIQRNIGSGLLKSHTWLEHAFIMTVVFSVSCVPTRVTIQGIYGTQSAAVVDNVPLVAALPASVFSTISHELFLAADTAFQSVSGSYMSTSEEGFAAPLKVLYAMRGGLEFVSSDLAASIRAYAARCSRGSSITMEGLSRSTDLLTYLTTNARAGGVSETYLNLNGTPTTNGPYQTQSAQAEMVSCNDAAARIVAGWTEFESPTTGATSSDFETLLNYNIKETSNAGSPEVRANAATYQNAFNQLIGSSGQSAQKFMQNSLMADLLADTYRCMSRGTSHADMLSCTQLQHNAMEAYKVDATASANMFTKTMLPAMTLLQLLFFAFGVIIFFYGMLRGALVLSALAKYMVFGMWVFSWLPFVAVINAFIQWMVVDKVNSIANEGLTMANKSVYMYDTLSTNLAMASDLLAITPLMTLGLLTGGAYAMTGVAQRLSAPRDYVDEKQAAPATSSVSPVVQTTAMHTSNAYKGIQSSDYLEPEYSVSGSLQNLEQSAHSQSISSSIDSVRAAQQYIGSAKQDLGGRTVTNSGGRSYDLSKVNLEEYAERESTEYVNNQGFSDQRKAEVNAGVRAAYKMVTAGAISMSDVLAKTDDHNVRDALAAGYSSADKYAEGVKEAISDEVATRGGTLTSRTIESGDRYEAARRKSIADQNSWTAISARSQEIGEKYTLSASSINQALTENPDIAHDLHQEGVRLRNEYGDNYDAFYNQARRFITAGGKTYYENADELTVLHTLGTFGNHDEKAQKTRDQIITTLAGVSPIADGSSANRDIGTAAVGISPTAHGLGSNVADYVQQGPRANGVRSASQMSDAASANDTPENGGASIVFSMEKAADARRERAGNNSGGNEAAVAVRSGDADAAAARAELNSATGTQERRYRETIEAYASNNSAVATASTTAAGVMNEAAYRHVHSSTEVQQQATQAASQNVFGQDIATSADGTSVKTPEASIKGATRNDDGTVSVNVRRAKNTGNESED
ncbi:conjugal transfer protein TraG N-terminal domain-containing protein [Bordetella sp. 15P40C-2]|uniref:conjugal transfer protein TraG N-terminal domain-containing protein n=1 Tax=Bordetella sp. 15P40C-2 TaxID=2572246 RepID=UPI001365A86A|nr:conjugal transfer protein TraG N-terminal domain-containing protein [Bordetella sp. 15P40C-2]